MLLLCGCQSFNKSALLSSGVSNSESSFEEKPDINPIISDFRNGVYQQKQDKYDLNLGTTAVVSLIEMNRKDLLLYDKASIEYDKNYISFEERDNKSGFVKRCDFWFKGILICENTTIKVSYDNALIASFDVSVFDGNVRYRQIGGTEVYGSSVEEHLLIATSDEEYQNQSFYVSINEGPKSNPSFFEQYNFAEVVITGNSSTKLANLYLFDNCLYFCFEKNYYEMTNGAEERKCGLAYRFEKPNHFSEFKISYIYTNIYFF